MTFTPPKIPSSEITPEETYLNRRKFMQGLTIGAGMLPLLNSLSAQESVSTLRYQSVEKTLSTGFYTKEAPASYSDATRYNNFYEFGTSKSDPAKHAHRLTTSPWEINVSGECSKPGLYNLEDILAKQNYEERIYRLRCVEAWSMVIPWVGFALVDLIKQFQPTSKAKYIAFETLERPKEMVGQRGFGGGIDWPYIEGLRMDEANNPLTFMAVGMYGKSLPPQNGAPIRLVVPWKYGFKSIKSIVGIRFTEKQPKTTWNISAPKEYGFYANVNPTVDHPRWSQASERRLPSTLWAPNRIKTQMFNGYGEQVAHLYKDMNLARFY